MLVKGGFQLDTLLPSGNKIKQNVRILLIREKKEMDIDEIIPTYPLALNLDATQLRVPS